MESFHTQWNHSVNITIAYHSELIIHILSCSLIREKKYRTNFRKIRYADSKITFKPLKLLVFAASLSYMNLNQFIGILIDYWIFMWIDVFLC